MTTERETQPQTDEERREETAEHEGTDQEARRVDEGEDPRSEEAMEAEMERLEENPPDDLEDWPDGPAKYKTFGGPEGDHSYEEGPERKLGPSSLRRREDGSVEIEGEVVDDPDKYKREPIAEPMGQTADSGKDDA